MTQPTTLHQHLLRSLLALLLCLPATLLPAQDIIRVTGKVVSKDKQVPLMGVNITDMSQQRVVGTTDEDGRFAFDIRDNATLRFSMVGAAAVTVKLKGRKELAVEMAEEDMFLKEATVSVKRITDQITPEPTTIEVVGNDAYIPIRVRVPREMFARDTRVVVQPVLNMAGSDKRVYMRPIVVDARTYHLTQQRMYNFQMDAPNGDPLARYVRVMVDTMREKGRKNYIFGHRDTVRLDNPNANFSCDTYIAMEDYNRIVFRDTTTIARGTVNPLRWLDYSFGSTLLTDSAYYPTAAPQLRDSKGQVNLRFPVGKATLDMNDAQNQAEVEKLKQQIETIRQNKDARLEALALTGTASPDGFYRNNLALARQRMEFALDYLRSQVPAELRRNMKFTSDATVEPWTAVADLLRADSLHTEADQIEAIVRRHRGDADAQSKAIRLLPYFKQLLVAKYLPRLRKVEYKMNYSVYRQLTQAEIQALYDENYKQLSRYEFFRLYRAETDPQRRELLLRQALEIYPSFMVAANDLQAMLIERRQPEPELLAPFVGKDAPAAVNVNHIVALLSASQYAAADTLIRYVPPTEEYNTLRAVTGVLNGHFEENYAAIAQTGVKNELLLLLAMKRDQEALSLSMQLPEKEAFTHYLRAVCYNRTEHSTEAYDELVMALRMDPSLREVALTDGDINSLLLENER